MATNLGEEKKLNREQLEAIKHKDGPLLIIAGAGTGKTIVITERIKYLILSKLAKPQEILALTFTDKAAREMEERVDIAMPYGYTQMWISTFHSFCDRVLRQEALNIGLDPRYKLMTQSESIQFIRDHFFEFDLDYFRPLGNPNKFIGGMLQHFSRLQDEDVFPNDYQEWLKKIKIKNKGKKLLKEEKLENEKYEELSKAYKKYDELKVKEGVLDFGDLIVKTLDLFRQRKNVLAGYKKQFKYILIDEFQDTNFAQNELAKILVDNKKNITVVGDDDQAVYRFRGASVSNIIQFKKSFPKSKVIVLTKNYRSTQEILNKAYKLIQHNNPDRLEVVEKIDKRLFSQVKKDGEIIKFIHVDRVENEADQVAQIIEKLIKDKKYDYKDFAILVRANNHSEPFGRAFLRKGIPYQFLGPGRLFRQQEVIDLISYLRVLYDFSDSVSLYRVLSMEFFDISPRDLAAMGNYARKYNLSLFEACEKIDDIAVADDTKEKIKDLIAIIVKHLKLVRKETAGQLLYYFLEETGLLPKLLNPDSVDVEKKASNISKFFDKLKSYEINHEDATVSAVVDWIELSTELGESPLAIDNDWTNVNAVNILTLHSAKGLEFPVVFLVNLVSQRFPSLERREQIPIPESIIKEILPVGDYHLEEERRLFYVGMTRAKEVLYLTGANYYGEGKREKNLSPFIYEALGDDLISSEQKLIDSKQLSFLDYSNKNKKKKIDNIKVPLNINYLSYSQINTFQICPLHYKLRYIFKVPTPQTASQSFGTSVHATLKDFYNLVLSGKRPTEKLIFECLRNSWVKEGFKTKKHERKFYEKGKLYLAGFLKEGFDPKNLPVALEKPFTIPLKLEDKNVKPLKIGGVIDRVDVFSDGSIEIIDYKTGANIPSQKEVDKNLQLSFYGIAATEIPEELFNKKPEQIRLSLYYLDEQEKITTVRTKEDLEKAKMEIFKIRDEIEKSDFACSENYLCRNCEYKLLCNVKR
ncbi:ATP-dependent helicase [Patescibacteria group bacterium]|nr:ATP-dependent helicase [Patescibacteria group bacterium]MBU2036221.1 ATP-dependent helicase [Patescibacteria group bacterium]